MRYAQPLLVGAVLVLACRALAEDSWVGAERANVRLAPGTDMPVVGELERGSRVEVDPGGPDASGWTPLLPFGAVRTRLLVPTAPEDGDPLAGPFGYVRVRARSTELREAPDPEAKVLGVYARGQILAVRAEPTDGSVWLETPHGEFLLRSTVSVLQPSPFHGVADPPARLAFLLRAVTPVGEEGETPGPIARGTALEVLVEGRRIATTSGTVPRSAVRLAWARPRPEVIGADERWVHVDTDEQTLTAYEGDRMVFATLVSTGKKGWETPTGVFRVWLKVRHARMHGHRVPYLVEEVPDVLYFGRDVALHAAVWHRRFGTAVSHGCVNVSLADGDWLFHWAPPEMPAGWHALNPGRAGLPTLWVVVEGTRADVAAAPPSVTPLP
ncbi:MAG: L,D-transpeptidase family protein [Myxococcaceae bacterium]